MPTGRCTSSVVRRSFTLALPHCREHGQKALVDLRRNPVITESALRGGSDDDDETSSLGVELTSDETPETVLAAQEIAAAVNAAMEALRSKNCAKRSRCAKSRA